MHSLEKLLRECVSLMARCASKFPERFSAPLLGITEAFLSEQARLRGFEVFIKYADSQVARRFLTRSGDDGMLGILIQGPIGNSRDLAKVRKSVDIYKDIAPQCPIVVSTWANEVTRSAHLPGAHVILTEDPGVSYPNNLLRQQKSTEAGLKYLDLLGIEFALKTRSDQRVLSPHAIPYLRALLGSSGERPKVWASSYGTGCYRIYGFTDQLQAGKVSDLLVYWKELDLSVNGELNPKASDLEQLSSHVQEIVLNTRWLRSLGWQVEWTWEDHINAAKNHFGILDSDFLRHVHLGRPINSLNHVAIWKSARENLIEDHLEPALFSLITMGNIKLTPNGEVLKSALKAPGL